MTRDVLPRFNGAFTLQEPIPEAGIEAAVEVLRSGRLHRYNTDGDSPSASAELEARFAAWQGRPYALALASGGSALSLALRSYGLEPGAPVLTNAFTLAPVPGAIFAAGGVPVLVEINEDLLIDPKDLEAKAQSSGAKVLMLSLMRGHLGNMDEVMAVARRAGLFVIEDCAHTMGATCGGVRSGNFGDAACFSTQTYKHINSGEGGFLVSDDPVFMARATIGSGSYMNYARHGAGPPEEAYRDARYMMPNCSARMDNLRAAVLLSQLDQLEENCARWNDRYRVVEQALCGCPGVSIPQRAEGFVGSSIQFRVAGAQGAAARAFLADCAQRGVELKWFGAAEPAGFTSAHGSWRYAPPQTLPRTDRILEALFDMRLPLTFSEADCALIGAHLQQAVEDHMAQVAESVPVSV